MAQQPVGNDRWQFGWVSRDTQRQLASLGHASVSIRSLHIICPLGGRGVVFARAAARWPDVRAREPLPSPSLPPLQPMQLLVVA